MLLVGPCGFPWTHRRGASNPFLQPTFAHEHPPPKHPLRRLPAERRGETPPASCIEILPETQRRRRRFAEDAGPPRGHPASNGSVLDGTSPASDWLAVAPALSRRARRAQQLFRLLHASPAEPSDAPGRWRPERVNAPVPFADLDATGCTSMRPAFARSEAPSAGEVQIERPREHPPGALRPVGRRAQPLHVFIDVRKRRLDRSFAPLSRAFPGRVRFHDFCRSMFQRALPWTARTSRTSGIVVGTAADSIDRCLSIGGDRRGYAGSGAEDHRASALPPGTAPESDFAPTPIASDTSCRGLRPSPCQELTRGEGQSRLRRAR